MVLQLLSFVVDAEWMHALAPNHHGHHARPPCPPCSPYPAITLPLHHNHSSAHCRA